MFKKYKKKIINCIRVIVLLLIFTACYNRNAKDNNLELTNFTKDLIISYSNFLGSYTNLDSAFSFIIQCNKENVCLFGYSNFSHKDYVGKAIFDNKLVKVYGTENDYIYKKKHNTRKREKYDTDGNYVEDLMIWEICISNDTIFFSPGSYDKYKVYAIRDVCRKHFPDANIFWQRNSFRLDDIRM